MKPIELPLADAHAALAKAAGISVADVKAAIYNREIHLPLAKDDHGNRWVLIEDLDAALREIKRRKTD